MQRLRMRVCANNGPTIEPPAGERLLVNGVAKSGTHLLTKIAGLMGYPVFPFCLAADKAQRAAAPWSRAGEACLGPAVAVGVERPTPMHGLLLRQVLRAVPPGRGINAHCGYSPALRDLLAEEGFRLLLLLRDPRDTLVSLAGYLARHGHPALQGLSLEAQLLLAIDGIAPMHPPRVQPLMQRNAAQSWRAMAGWMGQPEVLVLRFEDLVGPEGGGSATAQARALTALAGFLGAAEETVGPARAQAFGGTRTFHQGRIGAWREAFTPVVKARFHAVAGEELIRLGYEGGADW